MGPTQQGCLQKLFAVRSLEAFLDAYWPGKPAAVDGSLERLDGLASLRQLSDVSHVLDAFKDPVMVILPDERDESSAVKVDAASAAKLYENGMALCFSSIDKFIPEVDRWLHTIRRELGLPSATWARALVYAGRSGAGNKPHYDANANIVVQLRGTKRWTIAPNTHVQDPTDRWTMTSPHLPPELHGVEDGEMPREMPRDAQVVDLLPGSVLLVPRGYWHATEVASEDTLALNFTYSQPTWAEVVTAALLNRLHRQPRFRALADGLESPLVERRQRAEAQLARMLGEFKADVRQLENAELLQELLPALGPAEPSSS